MKASDENRYMKFDEYIASLDIERQKRIANESATLMRKIESDRSKKLEKERIDEAFWQRVRHVLTFIAIAIVVYTLFHFT